MLPVLVCHCFFFCPGQLQRVETENDLEGLPEVVMDVMEESGCDKQLKVSGCGELKLAELSIQSCSICFSGSLAF